MIKKVISGAQTGADQAGLIAAKNLGVKTGGWMPAGYRTAEGPRPDLAETYDLKCTAVSGYHQRTSFNVRDSDATIIFGRTSSSGSKLTIKLAINMRRPCLIVTWGTDLTTAIAQVKEFLKEHKPKTVNIAGNREEKCPGIGAWVVSILEQAMGEFCAERTGN